MRNWKKLYKQEVKRLHSLTSIENKLEKQPIIVKQLLERKRGRPHLLGEKLDNFLQELIIALRIKGAPINTNVVISIGRGIMLKIERLICQILAVPLFLIRNGFH